FDRLRVLPLGPLHRLEDKALARQPVSLRRAGTGRRTDDDLLGGPYRLRVRKVDKEPLLRIGGAEGDERVAARIVERKLERHRLAGGIDDAVVTAIGFGPALAEDLDRGGVDAG